MEKSLAWVTTNAPWLAFLLMAIGGGTVAHLRDGEGAARPRTLREHVFGWLRRSTFAVVSGLMWYFIVLQYGWEKQPLSYVGASLVGLFAPEFFDWLWVIFKDKIGGVAGIKLPPPAAPQPKIEEAPKTGEKREDK